MKIILHYRWTTFSILLILGLAVALPYGLKFGLQQILLQQGKPHGIERVEVGAMRYDFFNNRLIVAKLKLYQNDSVFAQVENLTAQIRLRELFKSHLLIEKLSLSGTQIPITLSESHELKVAGFPINLDSKSEASSAFPLEIGVDTLDLDKIALSLTTPKGSTQYNIKSLKLTQLYMWEAENGRLKLKSKLNGATINANLQLHLFHAQPKIVGSFKAEGINLNDLQYLMPDNTETLAGNVSTDMRFTLEQSAEGFKYYQQGEWRLNGIEFKQASLSAKLDEFAWDGDFHYFTEKLDNLLVKGQIQANGLNVVDTANNLTLKQDFSGDLTLLGLLSKDYLKLNQKGHIALNQFEFVQAPYHAKFENTQWNGNVIFENKDQMRVDVQGLLVTKALDFKAAEQKLSLQQDINASLKLRLDMIDNHITLKQVGDIQLEKTVFSLPPYYATSPQAQWKGDLDLQIGDKTQLGVTGDLILDKVQFKDSQQKLKVQNDLQATLDLNMDIGDKLFTLSQKGDIKLQNTAFSLPPYDVAVPKTQWQGKVDINIADNTRVNLLGDFTFNQLDFKDEAEQLRLQQNLSAALNLQVDMSEKRTQLKQIGTILLSDSVFTLPPYSVKATQTKWQGQLDLQSAANTTIGAVGNLAIDTLDLQETAQSLHLKQDLISQLNLQAEMSDSGFNLKQAGAITLQNADFSQPPLNLSMQKVNWQGDVQLSQKAAFAAQLNGQFVIDQLSATNQQTQLNLAQFKQLTIAQIITEQLNHIVLKNAQLTELSLATPKATEPTMIVGETSPKADKKQPGLVVIQQVTLDQADLHDLKKLQLGKLALHDSHTQLTLNPEGKVAEVKLLRETLFGPDAPEETSQETQVKPAPETTRALTQVENKTPDENAFHYSLQSLAFAGKNQIDITTYTTEPPVRKRIQLSKFTVGALDSLKPTIDTPFHIVMTMDEFTKIDSQGQIQPLNPDFGLKAKTKLDDLSLASISPLIEKSVGYRLQSGQLSAKLNTKIADNLIDADNVLQFQKLTVKSMDASKSAEFQKDFNVPLEMGLALLQDKNGIIDLNLPVTGNLDNPNFDIKNVIGTALNSAILKGTRTYLLLTLQPFGALVLAGDFALDKMNAIKLQNISFEAGEVALSTEMQDYLAKISLLLKERKGIQINLCGGATGLDRDTLKNRLLEEFDDERDTGQKIDHVALDSKVNIQLIKLATERQAMIKRYLIDLGNQSKQMVLCPAKINPEAVQPAVELSI